MSQPIVLHITNAPTPYETLGPEWMTPDLYRFGASALLNDLLRQIYKQYTGRYYYDKGYSID